MSNEPKGKIRVTVPSVQNLMPLNTNHDWLPKPMQAKIAQYNETLAALHDLADKMHERMVSQLANKHATKVAGVDDIDRLVSRTGANPVKTLAADQRKLLELELRARVLLREIKPGWDKARDAQLTAGNKAIGSELQTLAGKVAALGFDAERAKGIASEHPEVQRRQMQLNSECCGWVARPDENRINEIAEQLAK